MTAPEPERLRALGRALRDLLDREGTDLADIDAWYNSQLAVEKWIRSDRDLVNVLPHFVWHFFADADIRRRDQVYAQSQARQLLAIIAFLERGEIPPDSI